MIRKLVYIPTGVVSFMFGGALLTASVINPGLGDMERRRAVIAGTAGIVAGTACFSTAFRNKRNQE